MYVAHLSGCNHKRQFRQHPPKPRESIWCFRCQDYRTVLAVIGPWRVECVRCTHLNGHAEKRDTVLRRAVEHANEYGHNVRVWQVGAAKERRIVEPGADGQTALPI